MITQRPTQSDVETHVTWYISGYTQIPPDQIRPIWVLRDPPLSFDDSQLAYLALSLRGYVQHYNPNETVLATDTRKNGQSVKTLTALIYQKVK
jgi:hypothetical protein